MTVAVPMTKTAEEIAAEAAAAAAAPAEEVDNFAAAFEELSKLGDKPVTAEAMGGKPPVAAPAAPEKTVEETIADPADAADEDGLPNPDAQIAADEAAAAAAKEKTVVAPVPSAAETVLEQLVERLAPKQPARVEETPPPPPDFSPEEATFIANYTKEFPDVAKAEALIRRAEYGQVVGYVFGEVQKALAPLVSQIGQLSTRTHLSDLEGAVEDYADVRGKVVEWIGTQPDYLQVAYNNVVQSGTKDQVIDLINRYRASSGAPAAPAQAATSGQVEKVTELPTAAKQAAAKLAPVSSKRSTTVVSPSKEDFDGAFTTAAAET